ILAIGIVVDDAIVVVEAVHAQLEKGAKNAKEATLITLKEIAPAIVSITLVMASVFIPVSFIGGTSGVFYKQVGLTLAVAIFVSYFTAYGGSREKEEHIQTLYRLVQQMVPEADRSI